MTSRFQGQVREYHWLLRFRTTVTFLIHFAKTGSQSDHLSSPHNMCHDQSSSMCRGNCLTSTPRSYLQRPTPPLPPSWFPECLLVVWRRLDGTDPPLVPCPPIFQPPLFLLRKGHRMKMIWEQQRGNTYAGIRSLRQLRRVTRIRKSVPHHQSSVMGQGHRLHTCLQATFFSDVA